MIRSPVLVRTEAQLGVTHADRLRLQVLVHVAPALPLPAGVLLRDVDPALLHARHELLRVVTVGTTEVLEARTETHGLDTVFVKSSVTTRSIDNAQINLPSSPKLLLTNGTIDIRTVTPRSATTNTSVSAAEALELVEELHQTVMFGSTVEMISFLTSCLRTTNCGPFLLTKHTFKSGTSSQLSSDINWKKSFYTITILSPLSQSRTEEETEIVSSDVLHPVEDVTGEDAGVGLAEVTDSFTEDDGGHVVTGAGYDTAGQYH